MLKAWFLAIAMLLALLALPHTQVRVEPQTHLGRVQRQLQSSPDRDRDATISDSPATAEIGYTKP